MSLFGKALDLGKIFSSKDLTDTNQISTRKMENSVPLGS